MSIKEYRNFKIVTTQVENDNNGHLKSFVIQCTEAPGYGQGEKEKVVVPDPAALTRYKRQLRQRELEPAGVIQFGTLLADLLLPKGGMRTLFLISLAKLKKRQGLRLQLELAPTLAALPWEYMHIQRGAGENDSIGFLIFHEKISITRYLPIPASNDVNTSPRKRKMLLVLDNPEGKGYDRLDLEAEAAHIEDALKDVSGITPVPLLGATINDLSNALQGDSYDILHFSGHGTFRETSLGEQPGSAVGEGAVLISQPRGDVAPITGQNLANNVQGHGIQLAVLSACQTAETDTVHTWSATVAALTRAGVPVAVAMQDSIWDQCAVSFARSFYSTLAKGLPVDSAVLAGRRALYNLCDPLDAKDERKRFWRDWGVPVLYFRAEKDLYLPSERPIWKRPWGIALAVVLLFLFSVTSVLAAVMTRPQPPLFDGQIVFSMGTDGNHYGLYSLKAGADITNTTISPLLVSPKYRYGKASFSPNGEQIAYATNQDEQEDCVSLDPGQEESRGCNREIYVAYADGSCPRRLTNDPPDRPAYDDAPFWSPDGNNVLFMSTRGSGDFNIYSVPAGGGPITPLNVDEKDPVKLYPRYATYGPVGIIGSGLTSRWELWRLGESSALAQPLFVGQLPVDLPPEHIQPRLSPNNYLLFQAYGWISGHTLDRSLWIARVSDGSYTNVRQVVGDTAACKENNMYCFNITAANWSFDGKRVAVIRDYNGQENIWLINPFDDDPARSAVAVTNSGGLKVYPTWGKVPNGWHAPSCSPAIPTLSPVALPTSPPNP